jgi:hypothetical protein
MAQEAKICLFSLSKKDPTFRSAISINGPIEWLNGKRSPPHKYFFRSTTPGFLHKGSKILFSFENQIFGEANIQEEVQSIQKPDESNPETFSGYYKKYITLDPESIRIYRFYPTKSELLEKETFDDYQFSQLFSYLTPEQYKEILRLAER